MKCFKILMCSSLISLLVSKPGGTQQPLNLNFEQLSIEGTARPWSWNADNYTETAISLDSTTKYQGKYSLRMHSVQEVKHSEPQVFRYDIEPYELRNNIITIKGWIKTEGLIDSAYFTLDCAKEDLDESLTIVTSQKLSGTNDWRCLSINLSIPEETQYLSIKLYHHGIGTAWFDDFELMLNGSSLQKVEIAAPFTSPQLKWLKKAAYPIHSVDAGSDFQDLLSFKKMVGDAQIIALGESTHGTSEFFRLKHRVLEYAVRELGVRIFAIEDNQLIVERVNKYVMGGSGSARSSMYGMFSVWQNEEVHNLIKWMRNYNDEHPEDKVSFVGFDMQNLSLPIDSLYAFAERRSASLFASVSGLLDDLKRDGTNSYMMADSVKLSWLQKATAVLALVRNQEQTWLQEAKSKTDSSQIFWGIQYTNLVKQYAENAYKGHQSLYRDVAMAENVSWILSQYKPGTRMLVWAHDVHISLGEHPDKELNYYSGISMGSHLRKKYGKAYRAYSIWTYAGSYWAQVGYTDFRQLSCPLFTAPRGSLDEALHRLISKIKTPALLLDLTKARHLDWLEKPIPVRFANHVNIEYGYWTRYSIPYQFDGIFFVDQTRAASSYAKGN